jgi:putative SOS response-associated peptidase YedK
MCGRYTRYLTWSEIHKLYRLTAPAEIGRNDEPRYNIAPTQDVPFVTAGEDGNHRLLRQLHDRQPVILDRAYYDAWLDPTTPKDGLKDILSQPTSLRYQDRHVAHRHASRP